MKPFTLVAEALLRNMGYDADLCSTEQEAREKAKSLHLGSIAYPVYYFSSDTSGEKPYEEFYTDHEELQLDKFYQLGVVKNLPVKSREVLNAIFLRIRDVFSQADGSKDLIIQELKDALGNFDHIETGKSLDQRM